MYEILGEPDNKSGLEKLFPFGQKNVEIQMEKNRQWFLLFLHDGKNVIDVIE